MSTCDEELTARNGGYRTTGNIAEKNSHLISSDELKFDEKQESQI